MRILKESWIFLKILMNIFRYLLVFFFWRILYGYVMDLHQDFNGFFWIFLNFGSCVWAFGGLTSSF